MNQLQKLQIMIDAIGEDATESQVQRLVEWVVANLPKHQWKSAANYLADCGDAYYLISERCGECGV